MARRPIIARVGTAAIVGWAQPRCVRERLCDSAGRESMKRSRREFLNVATGTAALLAVSRTVRAQAYPARPVRWIVGFAPAGGNDIVARLMSQWLTERTGQQFIVDNKPGAATNIATEFVVNAPADGYTLLLIGVTGAINTTFYENLSFNFSRDIQP